MSIFSAEDRAFFEKNGYVVVPKAVPKENCAAVIAAMGEALGIDPLNPDDWYRGPVHPNGMVEIYQHQALWDNRQYSRVHAAFSELFGTEKLWVSIDRVNLKPPRHPDHPEHDSKGFTHWDVSTAQLPISFGVQGVLCLMDTTADMGGFHAVPELYQDMMRDPEGWLRSQPADRDPRRPDLTGYTVRPIPAEAGDLIIWHRLLAHGNGQNVSDRPRLAQYITMSKAPSKSEMTPEREAARQDRISRWQNRLPPNAPWAPGDPNRWEELHGKTAELTPLGRKLLGLDLWEDAP